MLKRLCIGLIILSALTAEGNVNFAKCIYGYFNSINGCGLFDEWEGEPKAFAEDSAPENDRSFSYHAADAAAAWLPGNRTLNFETGFTTGGFILSFDRPDISSVCAGALYTASFIHAEKDFIIHISDISPPSASAL